jgi:iron complex outermembrane receptor protein
MPLVDRLPALRTSALRTSALRFPAVWPLVLRLLLLGALAALSLGAPLARAQQQTPTTTEDSTAEAATVVGVVREAGTGEGLPGASIVVRNDEGIAGGGATDFEGRYRIEDLAPGRYLMRVSFVGYVPAERTIVLEAGQTLTADFDLDFEAGLLEQAVVSASRRREKLLEAPASVSVLKAETFENRTLTSPVDALRTVMGMDVAQTGLDRRDVALRGFNDVYQSRAFVLTDYRQAAVPAQAGNFFSLMPIQAIDLERVEVVRGPGSALYGPGVDNGVIHFFTKGPFDYPGATVSVSGGQRSYFSGDVRLAGPLSERLAVKVTGSYARGEDWALDPQTYDPREIDDLQEAGMLDGDTEEVSNYFIYDALNEVPSGREVIPVADLGPNPDGSDPNEQFDYRLRRDPDYQRYGVNGLVQYRPNDLTTVSLAGGYFQATTPLQTAIGSIQANEAGYAYGQLRVQSGGVFAQVFLNANNAGDSYSYVSGEDLVDESLEWNGQLQYVFDLALLDTEATVGGEADVLIPRTGGTISGRNEDEDGISVYGAYAQTTSRLGEKLDLTLAARTDYDNLEQTPRVSPRAALVYKVTPRNAVRATYNLVYSAPLLPSNFIDIQAFSLPVGGFNVVGYARGAIDGFTFDAFRTENTAQYVLPVPGLFGQTVSLDALPFQPTYAGTANVALEATDGGVGFVDGVAAALTQQGISPEQQALLAQLLGSPGAAGGLAGTTLSQNTVQLGLNATGGDFVPVDEVTDIAPLGQTQTQTLELGYRGALGSKLTLTVDGYFERRENFVSPLRSQAPLAYFQEEGLAPEATALLQSLFATSGDAEVQRLLGELGATLPAGTPPEAFAAGVLGSLVGRGFNNLPVAAVQPDQDVGPAEASADEVYTLLSYRNFGQVDYYGVDVSVAFRPVEQLDFFGNVSFVSDEFFDNEELDEANTSLNAALNAPDFKVRGGFQARLDNGLSFGVAGNYVDDFVMASGVYTGAVESYFLVDLNLGYDFQNTIPGLSLNVTAQNIFDNVHREFVGAPQLGRLVLGRLTYDLRLAR